MRIQFFIPAIILCCLSCNRGNIKSGEAIEIYVLKSYQTVSGKCQINPSGLVLEDTAVIKNQDILEYSQADYRFTLSETAIKKVKSFHDFTPFAVVVDKTVIYFGFYKPSISSSSCYNSITMDLDWDTDNKIILRLGYPEQIQGSIIDDQRNNPIIIATLNKQGKLK